MPSLDCGGLTPLFCNLECGGFDAAFWFQFGVRGFDAAPLAFHFSSLLFAQPKRKAKKAASNRRTPKQSKNKAKTGAGCKFQERKGPCIRGRTPGTNGLYALAVGQPAPVVQMVLRRLPLGKRVVHDFHEQFQFRRTRQHRHQVRQRVIVARELKRIAQNARLSALLFELRAGAGRAYEADARIGLKRLTILRERLDKQRSGVFRPRL